jgi:GNAT superfamily N-acetyltransferase
MLIRGAQRSDLGEIHHLIQELAIYEQALDQAKATREQLDTALFSPEPKVFCDLVESDEGEIAGLAIWFLSYSTWTGTHGIHLEDLFVREAFRGRGYGRALLSHLARICHERGYHRLQWMVLDWNTPALEFYRSIGAQGLGEWTQNRVTGDALVALAAESGSIR